MSCIMYVSNIVDNHISETADKTFPESRLNVMSYLNVIPDVDIKRILEAVFIQHSKSFVNATHLMNLCGDFGFGCLKKTVS